MAHTGATVPLPWSRRRARPRAMARIQGGSRRRLRALTLALAFPVGGLGATRAQAAPAGSSGAASGKGGSTTGDLKWQPPEVVYGGNAASVLLPFQIGIVGYLPKAKVALAYDRQIVKAHWISLSAGFLADRGNYRNFRMDRCGFENPDGSLPPTLCETGSVLGFDLGLAYVHKFYLRKRPWLVPFVRLGLGLGWWKLPRLRGGDGSREQIRTSTWAVRLDPAGGLRWFPISQLGIGAELQVPIGGLIHREVPQGGSARRRGGFLLGVATLLGVEARF